MRTRAEQAAEEPAEAARPSRRCGFAPLRALLSLLLLGPALLALPPARLYAASKPNINVTGYVINAELDPAAHTIKATAAVTFTATDTVDSAVFELHNALKVDKITDAANHLLTGERGPDSTINIAEPTPLTKGTKRNLYLLLWRRSQRRG